MNKRGNTIFENRDSSDSIVNVKNVNVKKQFL